MTTSDTDSLTGKFNDDLVDILELLHDFTVTQYRKLGLQLGLLITTLNLIEDNCDAEDYGLHVLQAWLSQRDRVLVRGRPTWNMLIGALQLNSVQLNVHVQCIRTQLMRR